MYFAPVVLQKCDLLQSDRRGEQCLESSKHNIKQNRDRKKIFDSKLVSWEWTGIRGWTIKDQNNYIVKLQNLGRIFQACPKIQQPAQHLLFTIAISSILMNQFLNYTPQPGSMCDLKYEPFVICVLTANHNESSSSTFTRKRPKNNHLKQYIIISANNILSECKWTIVGLGGLEWARQNWSQQNICEVT